MKECALGELITFQRGHDLPKTSMIRGEYPVVGSNGIIGYHNDFTTEAPSISVGRSGNVGNPFIYYGRTWSHNTSLYVKEFKDCDPVFMYYLLKTLDLGNYAGGSAVPTLNRNHIHSLDVVVPDNIEDQKRVACVLRMLDKKIELNQQINDNLLQQAQSVFTDWFVRFTPFADDEFIASPIEMAIPKSLDMIQIGDIPHILETGRRPKGGAADSGIPSVGAENVKQLGKFDFSSKKFIPEDFAAKQKTGRIKGYELLLYKDGGKPGTFIPHFSMFGEGFPYTDFFINEHVFKLDFSDRGKNIFAYFYMQTDYATSWLANNGGKAAIPGINQQDVRAIWIYDMDHPQIQQFCRWVEPLFKTIFCNCYENMRLADLRDTLLPKLMSGKIDISSVQI